MRKPSVLGAAAAIILIALGLGALVRARQEPECPSCSIGQSYKELVPAGQFCGGEGPFAVLARSSSTDAGTTKTDASGTTTFGQLQQDAIDEINNATWVLMPPPFKYVFADDARLSQCPNIVPDYQLKLDTNCAGFACIPPGGITSNPSQRPIPIELTPANFTLGSLDHNDIRGRIEHELAHTLGLWGNSGCNDPTVTGGAHEYRDSISGGSDQYGKRDTTFMPAVTATNPNPHLIHTGANTIQPIDVLRAQQAKLNLDAYLTNGGTNTLCTATGPVQEEITDSSGGGGGDGDGGGDDGGGDPGGGGPYICSGFDCGCPATNGCDGWCDATFGPCVCWPLDSDYCDWLCSHFGNSEDDADCNNQNDEWQCQQSYGICNPPPEPFPANAQFIPIAPALCGIVGFGSIIRRRRQSGARA